MCVQYCPTHEMLADYYTKPLQGSLYRKLRDVIMGFKHILTLKGPNNQTFEMKERIEKSDGNNILISNDVSIRNKSTGCQYKGSNNKYNNNEIIPPLGDAHQEDQDDEEVITASSEQVSFKEE